MSFTDPNELPEITRHPYSLANPQRGGGEAIPLLMLLRNNGVEGFIAGGFARWVLSPNATTPTPGDIDFYFESEPHFAKARWLLEEKGFVIALDTDNAVTIRPPNVVEFVTPLCIQLIKPHADRRCGSIFHVLDGFDLNICQAALVISRDDNTLKGYVSDGFIWGENNQKIVICNIDNPLSTLQRCIKYAGKGYTVGSKALLQILCEWDKVTADKRLQISNLILAGSYGELYQLLDR